MINAQEWLNEKIPTKEARAKIKQLYILKNKNDKRYFRDPSDMRFGELDLAGELDLSDFTGLTCLCIDKQPNLTKCKIENLTSLARFSFTDCPNLQPPFTFLDS
jgi:hypothetical protein